MGKLTLPSRAKLMAMLSLSFAFSYMLFFFVPLETYLHNPHSFVVGWGFLLPQLVAFTLIGVAVLMAILVMLLQDNALYVVGTIVVLCIAPVMFARFVMSTISNDHYAFLIFFSLPAVLLCFLMQKLLKDKAGDVAVIFLWGLLIASYVQLLFLNGGMPHIMFFEITFMIPTSRMAVNLIVWVTIVIIPCIAWLASRSKKTYIYDKVFFLSALVVIGMQTAGLVSTSVTAHIPDGFEKNPQYLSYAPVLELSSDDNIIVFILEYLDVRYMDEVLSKYPEIYSQLDGFTYYSNNVSEYLSTFPSITKMLTMHDYTEGLSIVDYWEEAWARQGLADILKENGYTVNMIIDRSSTYGNAGHLQNRADNLRVSYGIRRAPTSTAIYMGSISLGRLMPYIFKDYFLRNIHSGFANNLYVLGTDDGTQNTVISTETDMFFYEYLLKNHVTADNEMRVFNVVHMNSAHQSNNLRYDVEADIIVEGGDHIDSMRANFEILNMYFRQMSDAGIYDRSTIIIIGDHGMRYFRDDVESPAVTTGLLIKPREGEGRLERNSIAELSHTNFAASVLEAAGIPHSGYGLSYFDIVNGNMSQVRFFTQSAWGATGDVYEITGDANNFANWRLME